MFYIDVKESALLSNGRGIFQKNKSRKLLFVIMHISPCYSGKAL